MKPFAVAVVVLAATLPSLAAATADDLQGVIERRDGVHVKAALPLDAQSMADAAAVWAWSSSSAPRKLEPRLATSAESILGALREPPPRGVRILVSGWTRREELDGLRLIVAPVDMWRTVPEPLLPVHTVDGDGIANVRADADLRLRAVGKARGTMWVDLPRSVTRSEVQLRDTVEDVEVRFVLPSDRGLRASAALYLTARGEAKPLFRAQFASDERGSVRIPAVPSAAALTLIVFAEGAAPQSVSAAAADFPPLVRLQPDAKVSGRFVDEKANSLSGVTVESEAWVDSDVAALARRTAESSTDGRWTVRGLPRGRISIGAASTGRRTWRDVLTVEDELDVGDVALPPATSVLLTVVDPADRPLPNVSVTAAGGFSGMTDGNGVVALSGLAPDESVAVTVSAKRFITSTLHLVPPFPAQDRVVLQRAFSISGMVVRENGEAVTDAVATVASANHHKRAEASADGRFTVDVEAGREFDVTFESRSAVPVTRHEAAGSAGEVRDLGTIRLAQGRSLRGRVVDESGAPVAGARVWSLRPAQNALIAWVERRTAETTSGLDGAFMLRGLDASPAVLRIDAAGFAPLRQDIPSEAADDLGDLEIRRGGSIVVDAKHHDSATARVDTGGRSAEFDMISAPVHDGKARLRNVPAGRHRVMVVAGGAIACEQFATVREGEEEKVVCPPPSKVTGRVLLGGSPAFRGTLSWSRDVATDALVLNRTSPLGSLHQQAYGGGGDVIVPVAADGSFESDALRPGDWQVRWTSVEGVTTASRRVTIAESGEVPVLILFDGGVIRGTVVDREGRPVAGARVREIEGPLFAISSSDGAFVMSAVAPGAHRIQASLAAEASAIEQVMVEQGRTAPGVTLRIGMRETQALDIHIVDESGAPISGAFVFVEPSGASMRMQTTDSRGIATLLFDGVVPETARVAAFAGGRWAFGGQRPLEGNPERRETRIRFGGAGSLRIQTAKLSGAPVILSHAGGDLSWMLSRVGLFPAVAPERPLVVGGLPPGGYEVILGDVRRMVTVRAGKTATVEVE